MIIFSSTIQSLNFARDFSMLQSILVLRKKCERIGAVSKEFQKNDTKRGIVFRFPDTQDFESLWIELC